MLAVLFVVAVLGLGFIVIGSPVAFSLRGATDGWASLLVDSLVAGLVLTTLSVTLYAWLGWGGAILVFLLWLVAVIWAIRVKAGLPTFAKPDRSGVLLLIGWVVVGVAAIALRLREVNFLPWVGDMGAYVNWANEFVRTGTLQATWPPYYSSYLAISDRLFGTSLTTAGVPLAGLMFILIVARVTRALGAGRWATLIVAAAVTVSVEEIWYSSFPASESLAAPLFVAWLGAIVGVLSTVGRRRIAFIVASGVLMLSMGLLRGDGPISLAPLLVLGILALIVRDWRALATPVWLALTASLAGGLGSYWYGISRIPHYYIATQIKGMLPHAVFGAAQTAGLFAPSILTAVAILVLSAVVCAVGLILARRVGASVGQTRVPTILAYVLAAAIFVGVFAQVGVPYHGRFYSGEVWNIILRTGLWLTIALIVIVVIIARAKLGARTTALVLFFATIAAFYLALQSSRLKADKGHSFFLYWDRYLVSEYTPVTFVLLGLALTIVWKLWAGAWVERRRSSDRAAVRVLPAILAVILALAAVVPTIPNMVLVEKDTYMAGAYTFETRLISLIPSKSSQVLWSATDPGQAKGFFFPNTYMAFAKPLARTFGYSVPNIQNVPGGDFSPDPVLSVASLEKDALCYRSDTFVVFESQIGGPSLSSRVRAPGISLTPLGSARSDISLLSDPPMNGDWTHLRLTVKAWKVTVSPSAQENATCSK